MVLRWPLVLLLVLFSTSATAPLPTHSRGAVARSRRRETGRLPPRIATVTAAALQSPDDDDPASPPSPPPPPSSVSMPPAAATTTMSVRNLVAAAAVVGLSFFLGSMFGRSTAPTNPSSSSSSAVAPFFGTQDDIPRAYYKEHRNIFAEVLKVSDGDTYKLRHIPDGSSSSRGSPFTGSLKDHTITLRVYGVDTPETAKFGKGGQPYGDDAARFVEDTLLHRKVSVKLLTKDRYGRAVGSVRYRDAAAPGGPELDISEELLKRGLAVVYRQGGAEYDGPSQKERLNALEDAARRQRVGFWSQDEATRELPSEYKRNQGGGKDKKTSGAGKDKKGRTTKGGGAKVTSSRRTRSRSYGFFG